MSSFNLIVIAVYLLASSSIIEGDNGKLRTSVSKGQIRKLLPKCRVLEKGDVMYFRNLESNDKANRRSMGATEVTPKTNRRSSAVEEAKHKERMAVENENSIQGRKHYSSSTGSHKVKKVEVKISVSKDQLRNILSKGHVLKGVKTLHLSRHEKNDKNRPKANRRSMGMKKGKIGGNRRHFGIKEPKYTWSRKNYSPNDISKVKTATPATGTTVTPVTKTLK